MSTPGDCGPICGGGWPPKWTPVEVLTPEEQAAEDARKADARKAFSDKLTSEFEQWLINHKIELDKKKSEIPAVPPPPLPPSPTTTNIKWWWWLIIVCFIIILFVILFRTFIT